MDHSDIRFKMAAARRILYREGCDSQTAGHVSVRVPGEEAMLVTPWEYFDETLPDRIVKASFDLETLEGDWEVSGAVEFHAAIYRERPDVGSVIHHHGHFTSVISSTSAPIGQYNLISTLFFEEQALCLDEDDGRATEGKRIVAALGDRTVVLMKNHGCVVASGSLEETAIKAVLVEKAAKYQYDAMQVGGTESTDPEHLRFYRAALNQYMVPLMWAAHMRRLPRSDADLFEWAASH